MPRLTALATHLPAWGTDRARVLGADEDALTLAVSAGRAALDAAGSPEVTAVLVVTRDLPVLEGGVEPIVLAGLGLAPDVRLALQVGGPTAALDTLASAAPGTLVIAVDVTPSAAAAAAYVGSDGSDAGELVPLARSERSLPMRVRTSGGEAFDYADPRLQRVRGTGSALTRLDLQDKPVAIAGLATKEAGSLVQGAAAPLTSLGAASALFAVADAVSRRAEGPVVAFEQGTATAALLRTGRTAVVVTAPAPLAPSKKKPMPGGDIKFSLPAYERAFDSKVGLQAGKCTECGTLAMPPRRRCISCGSEAGHVLEPLPRHGVVYTQVTIHVPVPGLTSPYGLAIIELGDTGVRILTPLTGNPAAAVAIGDTGSLVLRKLAVRGGVPDYGYAFQLDETAPSATTQGAAQ